MREITRQAADRLIREAGSLRAGYARHLDSCSGTPCSCGFISQNTDFENALRNLEYYISDEPATDGGRHE